MNLADILIPKPRYFRPAGAERAERAESQQPQGLCHPPAEAERGGKRAGADAIRPNPPARAGTESRAATAFPPNPPNPPAPSAEIEKPLPVTLEYFRAQGVELLPDDLAFLRWYLPKDTARRNAYIAQYVTVWRCAMEAETIEHRKANQGRKAANQWLRQAFAGE